MLTEIRANKEFSNPELEINNKLTILEHLSEKPVVKEHKETVVDEFQKYDKTLRTLTYKVLLEKFNDKYDTLLEPQKEILKELITSIDNTPRLKEFYNTKVNEIKTTFASRYTQEVTLEEALTLESLMVYAKQATGEKFLINPNG